MIGLDLTRHRCEQKWSKGKVREKVANQVLFNEDTYSRCLAEVPKVSLTVMMLFAVWLGVFPRRAVVVKNPAYGFKPFMLFSNTVPRS